MLEISELGNGQDQAILANVLGGATGFVLVFVILACACWLRKSAARINEASDGYQDIRDTSHGVQFRHPFRKIRKTVGNGVVNSPRPNALLVTASSSVPPSRFYQFPAAPLPVLPTVSTPSASIVGVGRGNLTRESSTSELYASVDRNPGINDVERRRRSSGSREDGGNDNGEEHMYSKIRPPPGTYDEIDDIAVASTSRTGRSSLVTKNDDGDPFYSRVNELRGGKSAAAAPPPVPRLPLKRASHPYDYPKFLSQSGRDRWQGMDYMDASISRRATGGHADVQDGGDITPVTSGDAVYSKIESQYGGSEDPYSSIKSSEEHYSCVLPNRVSNGSSSDENADAKGSAALPPALHGRTGTVPAYGSIRPRATRFVHPRRSRSDGEEYSVIRKPISHNYKTGQDAVAYEPRAPPVPEKRYFVPTVASDWKWATAPYNSAAPSTSAAVTFGQGRAVNANSGSSTSFSPNYGRQDAQTDQNASGGGTGKREPSYRFITVRESLDALRARMEAAAVANAATASVVSPAAVGSAHSDSSLHYYATISEHSYEMVPSRRGSARNAQREEPNIGGRPVSYIDDDEYELGAEAVAPMLRPSDLSPTSTAVDSMNVSIHSQTGSHNTTSTGSHVTLVHVGGAQAASATPPIVQERDSAAAEVHLRPSPRQYQRRLDYERRRALMCRMASSDDSSCSIGAALSIDIESSFGVDEDLSTVDQRDFNPSTAGDMDIRSGCSLEVVDDARMDLQFTAPRGSRPEPAKPKSVHSPSDKSPEIVELETLENFNVSSSNSLNEEDVEKRARDSATVSYQL